MKIENRVVTVVACLVLLFGISACEVTDPLEDVELIVDVKDAAVDLGASGVSVDVQDGQATATTSNIGNELDVDGVELNVVNIKPSFFAFSEGGTAKGASLLDSGTLTVLVSIGLPPSGPLFPLPPVTVTIENNVVTDVQPRSISLLGGTYDIPRIQAIVESIPEDERPNMTALGSLTIAQAKAAAEAALTNQTGFLFSIVVQSNGISGTLTLSELSIDARVTQGAS